AWPGALVGACLAQLYLLIFPLYVRDVLHPDHFGTVAGFGLVVITFFFAYALFVVIGAELASWRLGCRAAPQGVPAMLADAALVHRATPAPRPAPHYAPHYAPQPGYDPTADEPPAVAPGWAVWRR